MSIPERIIGVGLTRFWPVYFGAEPCVASKTAHVGADVAAGRHAEAADQAGSQVADDVAVEVRQHEDVELLGPLHELHADVVDDPVPRLDLGVVRRDLADASRKSPSVNFMMFAL